jgi:hypothetical protein
MFRLLAIYVYAAPHRAKESSNEEYSLQCQKPTRQSSAAA